MNIWSDFEIKFICSYNHTFWLHLLREFIITFILAWVNIYLAIGIALGFNIGWETQDGIKGWGCKQDKLIIEGFNILDFIAGLIGIIGAILIREI